MKDDKMNSSHLQMQTIFKYGAQQKFSQISFRVDAKDLPLG